MVRAESRMSMTAGEKRAMTVLNGAAVLMAQR